MARVYGITIPAGLEIIYNRTLKMYDVAVFCNVGKNRRFLCRRTKYNLKQFTKLFSVAYAWNALSQAVKDAWYSAGDASGINGYALYTQDKIYRIMNSLAGSATPSVYHQYKIGHIKIESPANSAKLTEQHITACVLPADLKISYRSNLTASGGSPSAKIIFKTLRFYSGQNIEEEHEISLDLIHAWETKNLNIPVKDGIMGNWSISVELNDVIGDLYFDNLNLTFNATIQNHDPFCDFFPKYFIQDDVGSGVTVESIYCPDAVS